MWLVQRVASGLSALLVLLFVDARHADADDELATVEQLQDAAKGHKAWALHDLLALQSAAGRPKPAAVKALSLTMSMECAARLACAGTSPGRRLRAPRRR